MADVGKLCYKHSGTHAGKLCYKSSGDDAGKLIYKIDAGQLTTITFAWDADGRDLDICAFWTGAPDMQMGFGHNESTQEQVSGAYRITFSGDKRGTDDAEWVKIKMSPWKTGPRTFDVHFNFYGYNASSYPANKCIVIATQQNGGSIVLRDVPCSTRTGNQYLLQPQTPDPGIATTSDPGVRVTFDQTGHLQSMEII